MFGQWWDIFSSILGPGAGIVVRSVLKSSLTCTLLKIGDGHAQVSIIDAWCYKGRRGHTPDRGMLYNMPGSLGPPAQNTLLPLACACGGVGFFVPRLELLISLSFLLLLETVVGVLSPCHRWMRGACACFWW